MIERLWHGEGHKLHTSQEDSTIYQGRNFKERVCHSPAASSRGRVICAFTWKRFAKSRQIWTETDWLDSLKLVEDMLTRSCELDSQPASDGHCSRAQRLCVHAWYSAVLWSKLDPMQQDSVTYFLSMMCIHERDTEDSFLTSLYSSFPQTAHAHPTGVAMESQNRQIIQWSL